LLLGIRLVNIPTVGTTVEDLRFLFSPHHFWKI